MKFRAKISKTVRATLLIGSSLLWNDRKLPEIQSTYLKIGPNLQLIFSLVFEHLVGISKFELGKKEAFWGRVI